MQAGGSYESFRLAQRAVGRIWLVRGQDVALSRRSAIPKWTTCSAARRIRRSCLHGQRSYWPGPAGRRSRCAGAPIQSTICVITGPGRRAADLTISPKQKSVSATANSITTWTTCWPVCPVDRSERNRRRT